MSKIKLDKINFDEADFLVEVDKENEKGTKKNNSKRTQEETKALNEAQEVILEANKKKDEAELILNRARNEAQELIDKTTLETNEAKHKAFAELEEQKKEIIEKANEEALKIIEEAKEKSNKESQELIENSKETIEQERVATIKNAYDEGYKDGLEHIQKEMEEKIQNFDVFCSNQYEVRDKILKSANKDIIDIILNISKKILLKEVDAKVIDKIIKNTVSLLEKKENVNVILSEKYAKILFEFQKESLADEIDFNFEDFKQYENFNVLYNSEFDDDTIIVENLKERYDASINSQLDVIVRNIYDNTQNGKLDLDNYENEIE
ncbi:MAG: hypothetical protein IJB79_06540 [Candidatus Gastranaerophilales bacterium]|nr:hypothetical protein [Candidatus Gastranaerophilales bacterium]